MLETTHVLLSKAAEILETDTDTLLIAAGERRIRLFGLVGKTFNAYELRDENEWPFDEEPKKIYFQFVHIEPWSAYDLLFGRAGKAVLVTETANGKRWIGAPEDSDDDPEEWRDIPRAGVFVRTEDICRIKQAGKSPDAGSVSDPPALPADRAHASDALAYINQAALRRWGRAQRNDPSTQPSNSEVAAWLTEKGFSPSLAKHAAAIIRPSWAHAGRKPDA
ncbi:MAG: hypothetical protein ACYC5W_17345 [Thauera sp.]